MNIRDIIERNIMEERIGLLDVPGEAIFHLSMLRLKVLL
jgi:hypothetical protein